MKNETIHYETLSSPLGFQLTAMSSKGICALWLGDSAAELEALLPKNFPEATFVKTSPLCTKNHPLDFRGTPFQQKVWQALLMTKPGETLTYAELAERIEAPKAVRAVASACAANQIALLVPCHRILRKDGNNSGYRWGLQRKAKILLQEINVSDNINPPK